MKELVANLDKYSVCLVNNDDFGSYYMAISNGNVDSYQMLISFDSVKTNINLSDEEKISKIKVMSNLICSQMDNIIYVVINIPLKVFEQAAVDNDDRLYNEILNQRIRPITSEVHKMITGMENKQIKQTIGVIKKNDMDKKLAGWLSMKLGDNFIREIDYNVFLRDYSQDTADGGIAPINHEFDNSTDMAKNTQLVKTLVKPNSSAGFGSIKFIIITLLSSLVVGVSIGYLLMK